jgi:hypothetical protein
MKTIRIQIARWLARRDEQQARNQRRALRDHNRREETATARLDRRARARRLYAAWQAPHTAQPAYPAQTSDVSVAGIRSAISTIQLVRRAA